LNQCLNTDPKEWVFYKLGGLINVAFGGIVHTDKLAYRSVMESILSWPT